MIDFDLPLEELKKYHGNTPLPPDFDAFWRESLKVASQHQAKPRLEAADFKSEAVECFDLYFSALDGSEIHAKYLRPKGAAKCPVLFQFHGYTGNSGNWVDKLGWAGEGFAVAALDCRGQSGRSQDASARLGNTFLGHLARGLSGDSARDHILYQLYVDVFLLAQVVKAFPEVDATRMASMGGSQGGGLALVAAALEPGIRRVASQFPFLANFKRCTELACPNSPYLEIREYFRKHDPEHRREAEIFGKFGYLDVIHLAPRIQGEVLMAITLEDGICPPSSQFAAYNQLRCEKSMALYPTYGHEDALPGWPEKAWALIHGQA